MRFANRRAAGEALAAAVASLAWDEDEDVVVLGIPRGGVIVAAPVAEALGAPLDVAVARKVGAPMNPELAIGAVPPSGPPLLNEPLVERLGVPSRYIVEQVEKERAELERRVAAYREDRPPLDLTNKTVVVVDDGVATGATLIAILRWLRTQGVRRIIVAVPVGAADAVRALSEVADEVVCLHAPRWFSAVGEWYEDFGQTTDAEVIAEMRRFAGPSADE